MELTTELSPKGFQKLLGRLAPHPDQAGRIYEDIRERLMRLFEWRGARFPEELADETIDRVAKKLEQGEEIWTQDPYRYFYGVGLRVLSESLRQPPAPQPPPAPTRTPELLLELLDRALQKLTKADRETILGFYMGDSPKDRKAVRHALAAHSNVTANALRIRVCRIRASLEDEFRRSLETEGRPRSRQCGSTVPAESDEDFGAK